MGHKLFMVVNVDWFFLSHRSAVALAAKDKGWDVTIVTADTGKLKDIESLGLKAIDLPMSRSGMNIRQEIKTLCFLRRLYKTSQPDVVHHVGMKTILWGSLAARIERVPGIVNAISGLGDMFSDEKTGILQKALVFILRLTHHRKNLLCIFQNNDDWSLYVNKGIISYDQGRFIKGSGVNLHDFDYVPPIDSHKVRIILTARMIAEKGVFVLASAAEALRNQYYNLAEFIFVGGIDDHPGAITEEEMRSLCDGEYIQWLGYRSDIKELLATSHIVAFPSYYKEGLPKSLIEACAIGRPIITCDSVGCRDTVIDGVNGFLIPIKDVNSLIEKLKILIEDKSLRERMGLASRQYAEKYFSIETVIDSHLKIYNELIRS